MDFRISAKIQDIRDFCLGTVAQVSIHLAKVRASRHAEVLEFAEMHECNFINLWRSVEKFIICWNVLALAYSSLHSTLSCLLFDMNIHIFLAWCGGDCG